MMEYLKRKWMYLNSKPLKFLAVGVLNTVFGYCVYAALVLMGTPYLFALFVATVAGVIFNYHSFGRLVFGGHRKWSVFAKFVTAYIFVYGANAVLLTVLTKEHFINPYLAQIVCIPPSVIFSWILLNYWAYKRD